MAAPLTVSPTPSAETGLPTTVAVAAGETTGTTFTATPAAGSPMTLRTNAAPMPTTQCNGLPCIRGLLGGSLAATPRVGVLNVDRQHLRLLTNEAMDEFNATMPTVLRATAERLQALAQSDDPRQQEHAERALHHLYRLVRDAA